MQLDYDTIAAHSFETGELFPLQQFAYASCHCYLAFAHAGRVSELHRRQRAEAMKLLKQLTNKVAACARGLVQISRVGGSL